MKTLLMVETTDEAPMVLRQSWVDGETGDVTFDMTCGAGLGNPYMIMSVTKDGKTIRESFDVRPMVKSWVESMMHRLKTEVPA